MLLGLGCRVAGPASPSAAPEAAAPQLFVESEPILDPFDTVDESAWSGEWVEFFPGRPICQDRFTLRARGATIDISSIDCSSDQPYAISDVRWDGQTLRFLAQVPNGGLLIQYAVTLDGPEQISGTANGTAITWSRN